MGSWVYTINVWSPVMEEDDEQNMVESEARVGRPRDQFQKSWEGSDDRLQGGQAVPV